MIVSVRFHLVFIFLFVFILSGCNASVSERTNNQEASTATIIHTNTTTNTPVPSFTLTNTLIPTLTQTITPEPFVVRGIIADCRFPYGSKVGISDAIVSNANNSVFADDNGVFEIVVPGNDIDPVFEITAPGYLPYSERLSRMVEGAFHLIPKELYRGVYLVLWNPEISNPQNYHRKWEEQTLFVIVRNGANDSQINSILSYLATDEYRRLTGGRFTSLDTYVIKDNKPNVVQRNGKTVISFAPGIMMGGIAHSEGRDGVINYAEITWNVNQQMSSNIFWHEMVHTVTAGGHIDEWPSILSEGNGSGYITKNDEEILNCIYNSPPKRNEPEITE